MSVLLICSLRGYLSGLLIASLLCSLPIAAAQPATPDQWAAADSEASLLLSAGEYEAAIRRAQVAVVFAQNAFGENSKGEANSLMLQGEAMRRQGKVAAAQPLLEHSLRMLDEIGPYDINALPVLNNLARCYAKQSLYADAEAIHLRQLAFAQKLNADWMVDMGRMGLAQVFISLGEYAKAERAILQSRDWRMAQSPVDKKGLALTTHDLGEIAMRRRRYADARDLYAKSLELEKEFGGRFIDQGKADLAQALLQSGQTEEAVQLSSEVVQKRENLLPQVRERALSVLAAALALQGKYAEAEPLLKELVVLVREKKGVDSLAYSQAVNDLGSTLHSKGEVGKAVALYEESLAACVAAEREPAEATVAYLVIAYENAGEADKASTLRKRFPKPEEVSGEATVWNNWRAAAVPVAAFQESGQRWRYPQYAEVAAKRHSHLADLVSRSVTQDIDSDLQELLVDSADWYRRKAKACMDLSELWTQLEGQALAHPAYRTALLTAVDVVRSAYTGSDPLATINSIRDMDTRLREQYEAVVEQSRGLDANKLELEHRLDKVRLVLSRKCKGDFPPIP